MTGLAIGFWLVLGTAVNSQTTQKGWETVARAFQSQPTAREAADWREPYKELQLGGNHIMFNPVFVSPTMQWAFPNSCLTGPPDGPPGLPAGFPH